MYRFVLRPRWILSHLLVVAIVGACVGAGFWQLGRLEEKREVIDRFDARTALEVVPVTSLLDPSSDEAAVDEVVLRRVEVTGAYRVDDQVLVRNRTYNGSPGYWVLTPMTTGEGTAVVINRGWVPLSVGDDPEALAAAGPPHGEVTVLGTLTESQERGTFGPTDPRTGVLDVLSRADIDRLAQQVDAPVLPAYVTLTDPAPPAGELPIPVDVVEPGEGPHLGYAVQWFIFATIGAGGYPLVLRKVARDRAHEALGGEAPRRRSKVPVDD